MPRIDPLEKYAYLIGQKINKWTVLSLKNDRRHADAVCVCECGNVKPVRIINLINGLSKDCGCGRKQMLREKETNNLVGQKFGKLTVVELLDESNKFKRRMYRCICECGNEHIVPSNSLLTGRTKSCGCLNSYHNYYIDKLLNDMNIPHEKEYSVRIDDSNYRFDFYLPDYNLFIEYDGEQHYFPVNFSGDSQQTMENFEKTQQRDAIKNKYCEDNNINLLRIPYYDCEDFKNIDIIISSYLKRLSGKGFV